MDKSILILSDKIDRLNTILYNLTLYIENPDKYPDETLQDYRDALNDLDDIEI